MRQQLRRKFDKMMRALYRQQGAQLDISILAEDEVQQFIDTHADALNGSFREVKMSDTMRQRLERSNWVFSGMKTFHELGESFPSLLDEEGNRKPFERFLNDVRKVDETYNSNYLRSEYNFVHASAAMAAKWEQFQEDGDRYYLQYRTAGDDRVRPEHAALEGVTLPIDDPFWEEYYPPNGWNCRCSVVQVRKSKQPATDHAEAMRLGELATGKDTRQMFHFNPGKQQKAVPDYNPYTIRQCRTCPVAKGDGKTTLASAATNNQVCQACSFIRNMKREESSRRLTSDERREIRKSAEKWADKHLPKIELPDGSKASRLTVRTKEGIELIIGKRVVNETFSNCQSSDKLAKTMEIVTLINEWVRDSVHVRTESGLHHSFNFEVFTANYGGETIELKAKSTEGLFVYNIRLI